MEWPHSIVRAKRSPVICRRILYLRCLPNIVFQGLRQMKSKYKPVYFLAGIVFLNLLVRVIFSPLLLTIENDLGITPSQASGFFLFISLGYVSTMLISGCISAKLSHRTTILISIISTGLALLLISRNISLNGMRIALILLGMSCGLYLPSGIAVITRLADSKNSLKRLIFTIDPEEAGNGNIVSVFHFYDQKE